MVLTRVLVAMIGVVWMAVLIAPRVPHFTLPADHVVTVPVCHPGSVIDIHGGVWHACRLP